LSPRYPTKDRDEVERMFARLIKTHDLSPFFAEAKIVSRDPDTNGVDDLEQFAIWIYSSTNARWYEIVNGELWTGHPRPDIQLFSEILNCALEKLPPYEGKVYRGYPAGDLDEFLARHEVDETVTFDGFTSTSKDLATAFPGNVLFIIRSHSGRDLDYYADKPSEQEVLFPSGTPFKVVAVERHGDFAVIEIEEVVVDASAVEDEVK
jgi:hypothetical protein